MNPDDAKRQAAERACDLVRDGMVVGLGTGSTVRFLVDELGRRGTRILGVPTSERTRIQAEGLGIRTASLEDEPEPDLTIDGADEIDPALDLIKGGGGALLREKLVAAASRRLVVIADAGKCVDRLGRFPLPVEIVAFGHATTRRRVETLLSDLGLPAKARLRTDAGGRPFRTDTANYVLDLPLGPIPDPAGLAAALKGILGVVEHGLFVGMAAFALIGGPDGVMEVPAP